MYRFEIKIYNLLYHVMKRRFKNMSAVSTFINVDKKPLKFQGNTVIQLRLYYELPTNDFRDFTKSIDAKRGSAKKCIHQNLNCPPEVGKLKLMHQKNIISNLSNCFDFGQIGKMEISL